MLLLPFLRNTYNFYFNYSLTINYFYLTIYTYPPPYGDLKPWPYSGF